jgi:hypothetical protein
MRLTETYFELFTYCFLSPIIVIIGLVGNSINLTLFLKKSRLAAKDMYIYLFINDSISLGILFNSFLIETLQIDFRSYSTLTCKLYMLLCYSLPPNSPIFLAYVLIEKYLSIRFPVESNFMRKRHVQLIFILVVIIYGLIYHINVPIYYEIKPEIRFNSNETLFSSTNLQKHIRCLVKGSNEKFVLSYFEIFIKITIAILTLIISSILLFYKKIITKKINVYSVKILKIIKKDIKISIITIIFSFLLSFLNVLLFLVFYCLKLENSLNYFTFNIYFINHTLHFYIFHFI